LDHRFKSPRGTCHLRDSIRDFFGAVPGALKDHLSTEELLRISITALMAGGGILGLLQAVLLNVGAIFPAPTDAALAAVIVTFLLECSRRLGHGQGLSPEAVAGMRPPRRDKDPSDRT
jgi:hypothetical protein